MLLKYSEYYEGLYLFEYEGDELKFIEATRYKYVPDVKEVQQGIQNFIKEQHNEELGDTVKRNNLFAFTDYNKLP